MTGRTCIGLVRIGRMRLGIRATHVERVLRGPIDLAPFPQAPRHVLGAFAYAGTALPCVDLAAIVRPEIEPEAARPVAFGLILRHHGGRLAVQVDEVLGTVQAAPEQITTLQVRPDALFQELFTDPTDGRVAPVLEIEQLASLEGVRVAANDQGERVTQSATDSQNTTGGEPHVVFRLGPVVCAATVDAVRMVERSADALDCVLGPGIVGGFHRFRGVDCPVADLAKLLELTPGRLGAVIVLEHQGRIAAFPVDEMIAVESFTATKLSAVPNDLGAGAAFVRGTQVRTDGTALLVLDADALLNHAGAVVTWTRDEQEESAHGESGDDRRHFLIYRAGGGDLATDLTLLEAVFLLPQDFQPAGVADPANLGVLTRREGPVQLVSLSRLLGRAGPKTCAGLPVLSVAMPGGAFGFVIDSVDFLQSATPRRLPNGGRETGRAGVIDRTVYARNEGVGRTAAVLDLDAVAHRLRASRAFEQT